MSCQFYNNNLKKVFIDLGELPFANRLVRLDQLDLKEPRDPHKALFCQECLLVQIPVLQKAHEMFTKSYVYFPSFAKSWVEHARKYVDKIISQKQLGGIL